jgi:hypothetical protein
MAVTAHWIEGVEVQTLTGMQKKLVLRANLIGFHRIPGRHTGKHLAQCLFYILERLKISQKVWFYISSVHNHLNIDRLDG